MKRIPYAIAIAIALGSSLFFTHGQTIFHDTFANGSTLTNQVNAEPTGQSTSYQLMSSKAWSPTPTIHSGSLRFGIAATTAGHIELQGLFTNSAIALATNGDYVELIVTFVAATNILNQGQAWGFGLYNSGFPQSPPIAGGLNGVAVNTTTTNATGGAQLWQGYWAQVFGTNAGSSRILTRPAQNGAGATGDNNQDLVTSGSGSQSYSNPGGTAIGTAVASQVSITQGATYTEDFIIGWYATNSLYISNALYSGSSVNPANLVATSQFGGIATNATFLTAGFDSFAIGWRATGNQASLMDISSITINSINSPPTVPVITAQPVSASAPIGGSVPFTVSAQGINLVYQWKRGGTNVNSPNLSVTSGANSSTLLVSPITSADLTSYSCTVRGAGNLTVDSSPVSLSSRSAQNLVWNGQYTYWDLTNSPSWGASPSVWNYGDNVTFDDSSAGFLTVNLSNFLSAGTVAVTSDNNNYKFQNNASGGTIAGTARLVYTGAAILNMVNANTYSGGTLMSNAQGRLFLQNQSALGTGPVTNAAAGGTIEVLNPGSATSGLGDLVVNDNLTLQVDTNHTFSFVVLGNLRGVAGKTLTYNPTTPAGSGFNTRMRVYGANTSFDCNIVLNGDNSGPATNALFGGTELAFYNSSGTQIYNGAISGVGGVISRDSGTEAILNSADNSYSGGTTPTAGAIGIGANTALGTGPIFVGTEVGSGNGTGTIFAYGGARTVGNPVIYSTNNQTLQFGGTNALTLTGAIDLRSADFPATPTNRTFSSTNTAALSTLAGVISSGSTACGIIKTGSGALALTATETYTGPTLVTNSAGRLLINGSTAAASAVTAATNGNIGGVGTINGNLTINQGGTLAPGDYNTIGTLHVGGNLVNNGNISVRVNRAGSLSDSTSVAGTLNSSGTGTVTVTNLGAALQVGDSFTLFNHALTGAGTLNVTGAGVLWTNKLAVDGTIAVTAIVATAPGTLAFSLSNGNINLSWPANYQTWILQSNSTSLASANWFPVANSGNVTSMTIPVQPNRANVFYRLVAP